MENNSLQHHGVLGQKWGFRRYQNKDGSLTPAGKKRYNRELEKVKAEHKQLNERKRSLAKLEKLKVMKDENEKRKRELDDRLQTINGGKKHKGPEKTKTEPAEKKVDSAPKKRSIQDMSDDELRSIVNRMQLERTYETLNPKKVSLGKKFVDNILAPAVTDVGKNALKTVGNNYTNKLIKKMLSNSSKK